MTSKPRHSRKRFFINRAIQLKYFAIFSFLGGGLSTVWGSVVLSVIRQDEIKLGLARENVSLMQISGGLFWWFALVVIAMSALIGAAGVVITHRIAGPVFVMGRAMDELTSGKYPQLRPLRKSDDLNELYASLGALMESLIKNDRDELAAVEKALAMLSQAPGGGAHEVSALLREMHDKKRVRVSTATPTD